MEKQKPKGITIADARRIIKVFERGKKSAERELNSKKFADYSDLSVAEDQGFQEGLSTAYSVAASELKEAIGEK